MSSQPLHHLLKPFAAPPPWFPFSSPTRWGSWTPSAVISQIIWRCLSVPCRWLRTSFAG